MREIDAEITELLNPGDLDCDVACLVYDVSNPESFRFCATTYDVSTWSFLELIPQSQCIEKILVAA